MEKNKIKILLANDHKTLRKGIISGLKAIAPHIQIVDEAVNFQDLLKKIPETEFDILMSDDIMHRENILKYLPGIRAQYPGLKIILNSIFTEEVPHLKKAREWANGWLSFSSNQLDYVEAIETVCSGGHYYYKGV